MNKITHILTYSNTILNNIYEKTKLINKFSNLLYYILPDPLNKNCKIVNIRKQIIVIEIESAIWSINLRFKTPEIITAIQKIDPSIKEIKWYIKRNSR